MISTAYVKIWGMTAGAVAWDDADGSGSFEFEPAFIRTGLSLSPVMMPAKTAAGKVFSFPELRRSATFRGLPGILADSLPDRFGNMLIDAWLARRGRPAGSMNPVEMLCYTGRRGMGALEFEPPAAPSDNRPVKVEIEEMVMLASEILSGRSGFSANLDRDRDKALTAILRIGTSAGGARAKAVIAWNADTGEVRSGQASAPEGFRHWIIKFDGVADSMTGEASGYGRVEMAYHLMAKDAGIEMTECRLLEEKGRAHFMTRRFDRDDNGDRIHMQSLCAMRHLDFSDVNSFSYEQLFETARLLGLPYPQYEQIYRRMVFNVLARNCDDHTKNFAFLMDRDGTWRLSPAFDLCHTYSPASPWVSRQALSVNGRREGISRNDFMETARTMNIRKPSEIIDQVGGAISNWNRYAGEAGVKSSLKKAINETLLKV